MPSVAAALWSWDTATTPGNPTVTGFNGGATLTKSGVTAKDLRSFVRIPIQAYGTPPLPIMDAEITQWIRESEDYVEQTTGLLLTPTFVSGPPQTAANAQTAVNFVPTSTDGRMRQGVDFDLQEAGYDFKMDSFRDESWGLQQLRFRPLRNVSPIDLTAIKSVAFTYPLLGQQFPVPPSWYVEDHDTAFVRLVPSVNVQTLPLWDLQLSIGGFTNNLPGGIAIQYTAGLTNADYSGRFAFVKRLIQAHAAITALTSIQSTINQGVEDLAILVDGVQTTNKFSKDGPFGPQIRAYQNIVNDLISKVRDQIGGPAIVTL